MDKEAQKRNKKAQIKYKVIDESFLKRTITFILETDDLTRAEKRKLITPTPNGKRKSFADMSFNQLRAAQKAKKEAEAKKDVKEADESRRQHDVNWVKPKKKKEKPGETKFVPEPLLKEPTEEGK